MAKLPAAVSTTSITLPDVGHEMAITLEKVTHALGVPRNVLAPDGEIASVWNGLPGVLLKINPDLRDAQIAKMCVAVAAGLFDGALNFVWNASIAALRNRVKAFGLNVVSQIKNESFDETKLNDLKDVELLSLCLELNLIEEEGYFLLDQCRDIRNSFSAAHPAVGLIDDHECLAFVNRCAKYALSDVVGPKGVDIQGLINALSAGKFHPDQLEAWASSLNETHNAQRGIIFTMLHGIYCDPNSTEDTRVNANNLSQACEEHLTDDIKSRLINQHAEYISKGDQERGKASRKFFENLGLLGSLSESEKHLIISQATKHLYTVHSGWDNFYNEPPFAQRLLDLSKQIGVPTSVQKEFVLIVVGCAIGNGYGISNAALPDYYKIIEGFSPNEIKILFDALKENNVVGRRLKAHKNCKKAFKSLLGLIDVSSVPAAVKSDYDKWMKSKI